MALIWASPKGFLRMERVFLDYKSKITVRDKEKKKVYIQYNNQLSFGKYEIMKFGDENCGQNYFHDYILCLHYFRISLSIVGLNLQPHR